MEQFEINNKHSRFSEAEFYKPGVPVTIGGAGGIGSWLSLLLARVGCTLYIVDDDTVDETNMAGQLYRIKQIGEAKVSCVSTIVKEFTDSSVYTSRVRLTTENVDDYYTPIMFSGFDNMAARKLLFDCWKKEEDRQLFIDGRMLMESGQVYVVQKGQEEQYEATLFADEEVEELPCSAKATSHSAAIIAGYMVSCYNNYIAKTLNPDACRYLPFKVTYNLQLFTQDVDS